MVKNILEEKCVGLQQAYPFVHFLNVLNPVWADWLLEPIQLLIGNGGVHSEQLTSLWQVPKLNIKGQI